MSNRYDADYLEGVNGESREYFGIAGLLAFFIFAYIVETGSKAIDSLVSISLTWLREKLKEIAVASIGIAGTNIGIATSVIPGAYDGSLENRTFTAFGSTSHSFQPQRPSDQCDSCNSKCYNPSNLMSFLIMLAVIQINVLLFQHTRHFWRNVFRYVPRRLRKIVEERPEASSRRGDVYSNDPEMLRDNGIPLMLIEGEEREGRESVREGIHDNVAFEVHSGDRDRWR